MTPKPPPDQVEAWLARASRDLEIAQSNFATGYYDACAFYCQQSAEKHLKALYMQRQGSEAPRTHSVVLLAQRVGADESLCDELHDLETDYMAVRYPDVALGTGAGDFDEDIAQDRLARATKVRDWVLATMEGDDDGEADHSA